MKKGFCYWKPLDLVICAAVLLSALLLFLFFYVFPKDGGTLAVYTDGAVTEYSLAIDRTVTVEANGHTLVIEIKDGEAWVASSTCHDGTCRKKGSISSAGETVLCAPAGVLLRITDRDGGDYDASAG